MTPDPSQKLDAGHRADREHAMRNVQVPIPCMDDVCRNADRCAWACGGRYFVPGADDAD